MSRNRAELVQRIRPLKRSRSPTQIIQRGESVSNKIRKIESVPNRVENTKGSH
ncbi:hypothetical protein GME_11242 [Halomonas sp. TD01]|nr:hypothetical protein GME_11242 [Halomonas sp. TD01]